MSKEEEKPKELRSLFDDDSPEEEKTTEEPETVIEEKTEIEEEKPKAPKKEKPKKSLQKIFFLLLVFVFLILAGTFIGIQLYKSGQSKMTDDTTTTTTKKSDEVTTTTTTKPAENTLYVNAEDGLRLRKEPNTNAEIVTTMPYGAKLKKTEEQGEWIKVEYGSNVGWCMKTYTTTDNPLTYKNTDLGFQLTFPETWTGFKTYTKDGEDGSKIIYFALKTTDTNHLKEDGFESGYASLLAINVLTKTLYEGIKAEGGPQPTLIKEVGDKVYVWGQSNAWPADLEDEIKQIKAIIETFKTL